MATKSKVEYKIDAGIPIPPRAAKTDSRLAVIRKMKVGDSMLWPGKHSVGVYQILSGFKLSQRTMPDGTTRVWRVK